MAHSRPFLNGMLFSAGAIAAVCLAGIAFATWNAAMPTATPGSVLTSTGWNAIVDNVNDLNSRLTGVSTKNVGSVITRWGAGSAVPNTTLLFSGWGFANHYAHANNFVPVCLQGGDPGASSANAPSAYGTLLYPVGTGDATRMPPGVTASTHVRCSRLYVAGPTYETYGSSSCPAGWNVVYSGYAMGGYYNHSGDVNSLLCVDAANYDSSVAWSWTSGGTYLSASYVWAGPDSVNYPVQRYVKCAVCGKY